jgi:hypothetical protein
MVTTVSVQQSNYERLILPVRYGNIVASIHLGGEKWPLLPAMLRALSLSP